MINYASTVFYLAASVVAGALIVRVLGAVDETTRAIGAMLAGLQ